MITQIYALGTMIMLDTGDDNRSEIPEAVIKKLVFIDNTLSYFKPDSNISRINKNAGFEPQQVDRDTINIIEKALEYGKLSEGAIDLTVRPLLSLWKIGKESGQVPEKELICKALKLVNYRDIELDAAKSTIRLKRIGQSIDANCITKGFAADEAAKIFTEKDVKSGLINLGGNIYVCGKKPDGREWRIGVQDPDGARGKFIGYFDVHDRSVVTSGSYEKYFVSQGKKYHHIFNPANGYPVDNEIASVTVISPKSIDGDALTTCIFVLGVKKGLEFAGTFDDIDVLIVTADRKLYGTSQAREKFIVTDKEFIWN